MKIIAHRGASKQHRENTIKAFHFAADHGADLIEMDIRYTNDHFFVIFHDETLERVDGSTTTIDSLTYQQLCERLKKANWPEPLQLVQIDSLYHRSTPLLFHVKFTGFEQQLSAILEQLHIPFYLGVERTEMADYFGRKFGRERILGFMPSIDELDAFMQTGAGIIRLWESWLDPVIIQACHQNQTAVWIMTRSNEGIGETSFSTLDYIQSSGADGVLLNDICLAQKWQTQSRRKQV